MQDLTFKKPIIYSAFEKSSLYPFNPSTVLAKLKEFSTPKRTLAIDDLGLELRFEVDFQRALTPMSPRIYKAYTSYIDKKLAWSIKHRLTLTPTTGKLIAKREKAYKVNLLTVSLGAGFVKRTTSLRSACGRIRSTTTPHTTGDIMLARLWLHTRKLLTFYSVKSRSRRRVRH